MHTYVVSVRDAGRVQYSTAFVIWIKYGVLFLADSDSPVGSAECSLGGLRHAGWGGGGVGRGAFQWGPPGPVVHTVLSSILILSTGRFRVNY